ncbi:MAG: PAS domain S-box protein [Acidobacteria bacterium]|nr:PAS domain S-box protein [Acidobacteriota bacterium]
MKKLTPVRIVAFQALVLVALLALAQAILRALGQSPDLGGLPGLVAVALPIGLSAGFLHVLIAWQNADLHRTQLRLRESLELFDLTLGALEEAVLLLDPETGVIVQSNDAVRKIFGYEETEIHGQDTRRLHTGDDAFTRFEEEMKRTTGTMGFLRTECEMKRKNGECFPAELFIRPNRKRGGPFRVICVIRDLTEKKRMEAEAARVQRLESLALMAGGIAHDFNNMITAILGNLDLARMPLPPGGETHARLTEAEAATLNAKELARQLLTFAKGGDPVRKVTQLEPVIRQLVGLSVRGSNVKAAVSIAPGLWPVEADEGQIGQVIANLVVNAVQAMPEGGEIRVRAENFVVESSRVLPLREGRYLKITFRDEGVGIAREHLPRIFDPYFTTKPDGSGLGLATCYTIILKHDGFIDVESWVGTGSLFTVYLPATGGVARRSREARAVPIRGAGRVLVMDDEMVVRSVVGELARTLGYRVVCASGGEQAVELFQRWADEGEPFDAVILDLTVPGGMGAREAVRKILAIDGEARVIVSSGYSDNPVLRDFKAHGFCDSITKPYTSLELSRVLNRVTGSGDVPEDGERDPGSGPAGEQGDP